MITKTKPLKCKQMACLSLQLVSNFEILAETKKILVYMMGVKTFGKDKLLATFEIDVPNFENSAPGQLPPTLADGLCEDQSICFSYLNSLITLFYVIS